MVEKTVLSLVQVVLRYSERLVRQLHPSDPLGESFHQSAIHPRAGLESVIVVPYSVL
jgi:hypothetical protein